MGRQLSLRVPRAAVLVVPAAALVLTTLSIGAALSAGASTVTMVGAGDIASCSSHRSAQTAVLVASIPGTVFTLGDNAYDNGSAADYTNCYDPTWGRFKDRTRPVPGNHEYQTPGAAGYFAYFTGVGDPAAPWYAYDLGAWRIYALDGECSSIGGCGPGSAEEQWLRSDLAWHASQCVLAYWHEPRFSSGEHGDYGGVQALWQALEDYHAALVINGHDHDYERFAPQTATGVADPQGIVELVVGTGGKSLRPFGPPAPNSVVRDSSTYGILELALSPGRWQSTFVPVAGSTFTDSASGTCH